MDKLVENLRAIVGRDAVLADAGELLVYECDGLPQHKYRPRAVVFPSSTEETSAVMQVLARERVPFTPRGAGTGLSGGALALNDGVVVEMARMRRILKLDPENSIAVVQPGVVNAHVSRAAAPLGFHYVPDPSSNSTCTIGGNIAENAGGIHCLKYGTTTDHVLGARVVLSDGSVVDLGGAGLEQSGYDLLGVFVGSEGTFGIVTEATLRLTPIPPTLRTLLADFMEVNDASHAVSAIIAAGVMPAALEMMDHLIIRAVEESVFAAGLPTDAGAALLIELDGIEAGIDDEAERVKQIVLAHGARSCRLAHDEIERKKLWAARKGAFGAIGRIAPDSMIQDAVVPRSRLPEVLDDVYRIAAKYQLRIANVFHAGDGNLHPLICFDSRSADEVRNVKDAGRELMATCVRAGGSITGEHGVGLDKRELLSLIFSDADMDAMLRVRAAFDPLGLMNPGKIIPVLRGCGEGRAVASVSSNGAGGRGDGETGGGGDAAIGRPATTVSSPHFHFDTTTAYQQLTLIVGEANTHSPAAPTLPISPSPHPASPLRPVSPSPHLVVTPRSIDEVCDVIHLAANEGWSVVPAGGGSWLDVGNSMREVDLVVKTTNLNRIMEHEPADLIATAEAGVTLCEFNAELASRGQWLPLDPPDDGRATLGGVVATGLAGPQRIGYGSPRTFVIGMKVVLPDGTRIKAGGRVVKNVAGYDLCKLFTGSYGTLGIITELTFKLRPLPQASSTILLSGDAENLLIGATALLAANLFPVAVELLSPQFAAESQLSSGDDGVLLIRFAGLSRAVDHQSSVALNLLKEYSRSAEVRAGDDEHVWRDLAAKPFQFQDQAMWRVSIPPSALGPFLNSMKLAGRKVGDTSKMWQASVGEGRVRVIEPAQRSNEELHKSIIALRTQAEGLGGSAVIESLPAGFKGAIDAWGIREGQDSLMKRIKQQFDPMNILSPGRFDAIMA